MGIVFEKLVKAKCWDDKYGSYGTLNEAKIACKSDKTCAAVYDPGCNDANECYLCPNDTLEWDYKKSSPDCVYLKAVASGNYC